MAGPVEISIGLTGGLATFFAPCAYALLPGYVGYAVHATDNDESLSNLLARGLVAGAGVLVTLGLMVMVLLAIGQQAVSGIRLLEPLVGVVIAGFGVLLVLDRAPSLTVPLPARRVGVLGFGLFGAGYALAAVGCTIPVFLGVVGAATTGTATATGAILGTYVGVVVIFMIAATILAGVGADAGLRRFGMHGRRLQQLAGVVLILAGIGQLIVAFSV